MNVARKLIKELYEKHKQFPIAKDSEVDEIFTKLFEWLIWHEKMFDHTRYGYGIYKQDIEGWLEFHDRIMEMG